MSVSSQVRNTENIVRNTYAKRKSIQNKFENGEQFIARLYGYNCHNNILTINDETSQIVKQVFADYIGGYTIYMLRDKLNELAITAPDGGKWYTSTVYQMLTNIRYTGNAVLQKYYSPDNGMHSIINNGEREQFYIQESHPAIISQADFDLVQQMLGNHSYGVKKYDWYKTLSVPENKNTKILHPQLARTLTDKLFCGKCGSVYWSCNNNKRILWKCSKTFGSDGGKRADCDCANVHEEYVLEQLKQFGGVLTIKLIEVQPDGLMKVVLKNGQIKELPTEPPASRKYQFSGIVFCKICGSVYYPQKSSRGFYWVCKNSCGNRAVTNDILTEYCGNIAEKIMIANTVTVETTEGINFDFELPPKNKHSKKQIT
jgi:hypothetical protein